MSDDSYSKRDVVLLYCPKKVGSTAIVSSIRLCAAEKFFVLHSHDDIILSDANKKCKNLTAKDLMLNTSIINPLTGKPRKIYVIDIYRPEIERRMSQFFHELSTIHYNTIPANINVHSVEKLINRFNNIFQHMESIDYFKEIYPTTYDHSNNHFNNHSNNYKHKKYLLHEENGVTYIKLRFKDQEEWGQILTTILDTPITMIRDNETSEKELKDLYAKFKSKYLLPYNFFNEIENSLQLNSYYSTEEKYEYLNEWSKKLTGIFKPFTSTEYLFYTRLCSDNQLYFQKLHGNYKDDGCMCNVCKYKRSIAIESIKNKKKFEPIIHNSIDLNRENCILVRIFDNFYYEDIIYSFV